MLGGGSAEHEGQGGISRNGIKIYLKGMNRWLKSLFLIKDGFNLRQFWLRNTTVLSPDRTYKERFEC